MQKDGRFCFVYCNKQNLFTCSSQRAKKDAILYLNSTMDGFQTVGISNLLMNRGSLHKYDFSAAREDFILIKVDFKHRKKSCGRRAHVNIGNVAATLSF